MEESIYCGHTCKCTCIEECQFSNKMKKSKVKTADKQNDNIKLIVKLEQIRNSTYNLFGKKPLAFEKSFLKNLNANGVFLFHTDKPFKDMQSHITKLEATNSEYKKQISEYEFHLIEARRVKDNAKLKLISEQNKHAEYLREAGEKFIELEARNKELEEMQRNYNSDKKHYAVIEKSNERYVKLIDKHIKSGDNLNYKNILKTVVTLLEAGKSISALEIAEQALNKK